jgi:hypothetical protein
MAPWNGSTGRDTPVYGQTLNDDRQFQDLRQGLDSIERISLL